MNIEKDMRELVTLERRVRTLDTLIQHLSSMDDEELKKALPRILKSYQATEVSLPPAEPTKNEMSIFLPGESGCSLRRRFCSYLRDLEPMLKKILSPFRFSSRQQNTISAP